jgi:hypothetical protein
LFGFRQVEFLQILPFLKKCHGEETRFCSSLVLIAFLDGDENKGRAKFANEKNFIGTLQRPALTWLP